MDFLELLASKKIEEALKMLKAKEGVKENALEYANNRKVRSTQVGKREDKVSQDSKQSNTIVAKIAIPFQRQIVLTASTFLLGSPVNLVNESEQDDDFKTIQELWKDLRLDSMLLDFCETVKSETEATIVFYNKTDSKTKEVKVKAKLINSNNGNVFPVFDEFGDLVSFVWEYSVGEVKYIYAWTKDWEYKYKLEKSDWSEIHKKPNLLEKIPVIYMSQDHPEWWEVQDLIDNFEMGFSRLSDTNGYFASPMLKVKGAADTKIKKDATGTMIKLPTVETAGGNLITADVDVVSWDRASESLKLEFDLSKQFIYALTNTPDVSFDNVKGLGNVSGVALRLMFLGTILKSKKDEGKYQIVISRIISLLKSISTKIKDPLNAESVNKLKIKAEFTSVLPENLKETIEILSGANGGKPIMSQETAIKMNPLITDAIKELEEIAKENKGMKQQEEKELFDD